MLRRVTLAAFSALLVTRVFYPSEDAATGTGIWWVLAMLVTLGLGVLVQLLGERTLYRLAWTDLFVLILFALVGVSVSRGLERRVAITLGWEWAALGAAYLIARNLTRSRKETEALTLVWVASATAVAVFGLFQVLVEIPELQQAFRADPERMLRRMGIEPGTSAARLFQARALDSKEPFATFGLANSLAGFIVGPLAVLVGVAIENLRGKGSRWSAYLMAAIPAGMILVCLLLTKSRSAYVGLLVATGLLGLRAWARVSRKSLLIAASGGAIVLTLLIAAGLATRQLDRQVLTESTKSLKYRLEYWRATWDLLLNKEVPYQPKLAPSASLPGVPEDALSTDSSSRPEAEAFWWGLGPGNFAGPYLRHKLPEASEEILDPHNLVLEVWATAGAVATAALIAALATGIFASFRADPNEDEEPTERPTGVGASRWIIAGGPAGWALVALTGSLNPFMGDLLARWIILGAVWALAVGLLLPLWRRRGIPSAAVGAGTAAIAVNLLAAGGIGVPSVAVWLWVGLALGMTLRESSPCGRIRESKGYTLAILLACGWAALIGTFQGSVLPSLKCKAALRRGDAYASMSPPAFEDARREYLEAAELDRLDPQPWISLAGLEFKYWTSPEASNRPNHWQAAFLSLDKAFQPPLRNPDSIGTRRIEASLAREIVKELQKARRATPGELLMLRIHIVRATRNIARMYPTSADVRSQLAFASADLGMYDDALAEARIALELDGITPHVDKKLDDRVRRQLVASLTTWEEARKAAAEIRDKGKGK